MPEKQLWKMTVYGSDPGCQIFSEGRASGFMSAIGRCLPVAKGGHRPVADISTERLRLNMEIFLG